MNRERGFTVLELMITLAVAAVIMGWAVPSFRQMLAGNRLVAQNNELVSTLSFARSEATKRGLPVTVCRSSNGTSCATSGSWTSGWIVFVETATAGTTGTVDTGEPVVSVRSPMSGNNTLSFNAGGGNRITYDSQGMTRTNGTFTLCDGKRPGYSRQVAVSVTGRASSSYFNGNASGC